MKCQYCNAEIKEGLTFCTQCGKKLSLSEQRKKGNEKGVSLGCGSGCCIFLLIFFLIGFISAIFGGRENKNNPKNPREIVYSQNIDSIYGIGTAVAERAVQQTIQKEFNEKLEFYGVMWSMTCVDPMKLGLYTYKNKFKGEISKREHSYSFRFGINKLVNGGEPKVYYISVDGETWYFNEDGEDRFMSASERALKREEEKLTKPTSSK